MGTWDQLASLPLEIDRYDLEGRELAFSEEFVRYTTLITLHGGGEEGGGDDGGGEEGGVELGGGELGGGDDGGGDDGGTEGSGPWRSA